MDDLKEDIFNKAHLEESSKLAKDYFVECGLKIDEISKDDYIELRDLISKEINILLADKSYHMVPDLRMENKIDKNKEGVFLRTNGSYFKKRQAISFYFSGEIYFCSWSSGCNRIPFIKGFISWCNYMLDKQ